jgi:hypothetical protein
LSTVRRTMEAKWRSIFSRRRGAEAAPLRGEVLSLESLEERAKTLAAAFTLARNPRMGRHHVLPRLADNLLFPASWPAMCTAGT